MRHSKRFTAYSFAAMMLLGFGVTRSAHADTYVEYAVAGGYGIGGFTDPFPAGLDFTTPPTRSGPGCEAAPPGFIVLETVCNNGYGAILGGYYMGPDPYLNTVLFNGESFTGSGGLNEINDLNIDPWGDVTFFGLNVGFAPDMSIGFYDETSRETPEPSPVFLMLTATVATAFLMRRRTYATSL